MLRIQVKFPLSNNITSQTFVENRVTGVFEETVCYLNEN